MTIAAVTSFLAPRDSASVQRVAAILGCDDSTIRKMVAAGDLEGFTLGKRAIRIYLDSVAAYQHGQARPATAKTQEKTAAKRRVVTHAAAERAMQMLRAAGFAR